MGPFVHGRLQNLQTSEVTFAHVITPLKLVKSGTIVLQEVPGVGVATNLCLALNIVSHYFK